MDNVEKLSTVIVENYISRRYIIVTTDTKIYQRDISDRYIIYRSDMWGKNVEKLSTENVENYNKDVKLISKISSEKKECGKFGKKRLLAGKLRK